MNTHLNTKVKAKSRIETGDILLAQPFWAEENYKRSVILILDNDRWGSTGIILNKISNLVVHDALPQFNIYQPMYFGGEKKIEEVNFIHNFPALPNVRPLGNGLFIGGEAETLQNMIMTNMVNGNTIKFCAGLVEWAKGELDAELEDNKWWKADINPQELFAMPYEKLWAYKLLNTGHMYGIFNDCDDPYLN